MLIALFAAAVVTVECESFERPGGWSLQTHSIRQEGTPYLMAHGYGEPVADAVTTIVAPETGTYTFWARTRNWLAPWRADKAPGRFQVVVDGRTLPTELGTNGDAWAWQTAGVVRLEAGRHKLALHDLTGFNARCDKILFSTYTKTPRERHIENTSIATSPADLDLVVVGGGVAGICTALSASRCGVKTLLLQDRDVLGGCNSSEVRVGLGGRIHCGRRSRDEDSRHAWRGGGVGRVGLHAARRPPARRLRPIPWRTQGRDGRRRPAPAAVPRLPRRLGGEV